MNQHCATMAATHPPLFFREGFPWNMGLNFEKFYGCQGGVLRSRKIGIGPMRTRLKCLGTPQAISISLRGGGVA